MKLNVHKRGEDYRVDLFLAWTKCDVGWFTQTERTLITIKSLDGSVHRFPILRDRWTCFLFGWFNFGVCIRDVDPDQSRGATDDVPQHEYTLTEVEEE